MQVCTEITLRPERWIVITITGGSGYQQIVAGGCLLIVAQDHGRGIVDQGIDGPVEWNSASCSIIPQQAHAVLIVLDIVTIADREGHVNFVLQRWRWEVSGPANARLHTGKDGQIVKVIGCQHFYGMLRSKADATYLVIKPAQVG